MQEFKERVREAAENDEYKLRDEGGFIYWVDTVDEGGIHYHSDEGDTYRAGWEQAREWFEVVES